jgi:hypothetical protein
MSKNPPEKRMRIGTSTDPENNIQIEIEKKLSMINAITKCGLELIKDVYGRIREANDMGLSFKQILLQLNEPVSQLALMKILDGLLEFKLARLAGFSVLHYIHPDHETAWVAKLLSRNIRPFMWYNQDGTFNSTVYRTCVQNVMGHIIKKPGINEVY